MIIRFSTNLINLQTMVKNYFHKLSRFGAQLWLFTACSKKAAAVWPKNTEMSFLDPEQSELSMNRPKIGVISMDPLNTCWRISILG